MNSVNQVLFFLPSLRLGVMLRPYAIPHVTKCETDNEQKAGYYVAILSGKKKRLRSMELQQSTLQGPFSQAQDFTFLPRIHKASTEPKAYLHTSLTQ